MSRAELEIQQVEQLKNQIKQLKNSISDISSRRKALGSQPLIRHGKGLGHAFGQFMPKGYAPTNVGHLNHVSWYFQYTMNFDLSETNDWPNLTSNTKQVRSFQVSQEAAFLMMGVMRHAEDYDDAGDLGPITIEFRDKQSSRFFNDNPIPIQMIASKGYVSYMPVPMLVLPNAQMEVTMGTHLADGVSQNVPGTATGKHNITCWGYRIRVKDADKVLSSIFG